MDLEDLDVKILRLTLPFDRKCLKALRHNGLRHETTLPNLPSLTDLFRLGRVDHLSSFIDLFRLNRSIQLIYFSLKL